MTFASSLFTLEMFEMANAENIETGDFSTVETKAYTYDEYHDGGINAPKIQVDRIDSAGFPIIDLYEFTAPEFKQIDEYHWILVPYHYIKLPFLVDADSVKIKG
jgi:hypothetical protein